jgi:UDP-N-acetylglucosamine 2-epimerase
VKLLTVIGARPQFVKAAVLSRALRQRHQEIILHTGQHYDDCMSGRFFRELGLPPANRELGVGSGTHAQQTAAMMIGIEDTILRDRPDAVVVLGDTNSTLAGALAAAKLRVPVAHVEAGLRSHNRAMAEEINRLVVDHLSDWLFCPSESAATTLRAEGIARGVHVVGDLMAEALEIAASQDAAEVLARLRVKAKGYLLATIHRAENTDDPVRLQTLVNAFARIDEPIVLPVHPRTANAMRRDGLSWPANVRAIEPVGYLEMVLLERHARMILTDSGGVQKEAYWLGVPCLTLREETEWVETVCAGWNLVTGVDADRIVDSVRTFAPRGERPSLYVDGRASARIAAILEANV